MSATIVVTLGILAYLSGNVIYADYLNIMYIPSSGELVVYAAAFAGALFGFLWYNCYPAQVFMGDTGSLAIGGIIAVFALLIRKELLLRSCAESSSSRACRSFFRSAGSNIRKDVTARAGACC